MSEGRVLYVTYDGLMEPLGASQVVPVVEGLAGEGFRLEVLSFEKPRDLARRDEVAALRTRLQEVGVKWAALSYHARPSLPATAFDVWRGARAVRRAAREAGEGGLLVHARSYVPAFMGLRGLGGGGGGAGLSGKVDDGGKAAHRLLFDMRGFWVDERVEAGRWREGSPVVSSARRAERRLLAEADHLVHLTRAGMDGVSRLAPDVEPPPGTVIPTCVDLGAFRPPEDRAGARRGLGLGDGPVMVHTGTLSGWYMGEETFRLAGALVERTGGEFVVITGEEALAGALARETGVKARILSLPHREVPRWLQAADVGLALVRPGFAKTASVPTKIGEYLASGLLVVSVAGVGDLEAQFRDSEVAFAISPDVPVEAVVAGVLRSLQLPGRAGAARALAARYFDLGEAVQAYGRVYRAMGLKP